MSGLPLLAVVVVLSSALLHATWNLLLSRVPKGHDTTAVATTLGLLAWTPLAVARWHVRPGAWPYLLASAALELAYFAALNLAYARAPAHAVYPVARGLAPALLLPIAAVAGFSWWTGLGVLAVTGGVLLTTWGEADRRSLLSAVPVAACIAGYTIVDARGLQYADPVAYLWLVMCPVALVLLVSRVVVHRGVGFVRPQLRGGTAVLGLGVFAAYGLTLVALSLVSVSQVPAVAALRESSILFVLALAWLQSRSTMDKRGPTIATAAGATLVFTGVAVLALA
jgi:drug/metabolite transporter (DMT)-like permease